MEDERGMCVHPFAHVASVFNVRVQEKSRQQLCFQLWLFVNCTRCCGRLPHVMRD